MEVTFQNVSKKYKGTYALEDFTATLREGVYGLLGANGAGKTTLINIFVGILQKDCGAIRMDGQDIGSMGTHFLAQLGYLPQYPVFYRDFTVMDFLLYLCALKGISERQGKERARALLSVVNLLDAQNKKIGALSGGMRQRVGIVQAMLGDPKLLILDEPTAGLDPGERIRFRNLISRLAQGRTILLATHIVSDVACIAKEIILLKKGKLVVQGTPAALEHTISGKVWDVTVGAEEALQFSDLYCVSNMKQQGESFDLRIICDECPVCGATAAHPNLEDVFLFYFRENHYDTSHPV